jgi:hypothetical protein
MDINVHLYSDDPVLLKGVDKIHLKDSVLSIWNDNSDIPLGVFGVGTWKYVIQASDQTSSDGE